ncbi:hypothetical protein [Mycolicibacterium sp. A43C]
MADGDGSTGDREPDVRELEPTATFAPKKSVEERLKNVEHTMKLVPILISVFALVASIGSATAAGLSFWTARQSLQVARDSLATSGAVMAITGTMQTAGACNDPKHPFTARVEFSNQGRTSGQVTMLMISMREQFPEDNPEIHNVVIASAEVSTEVKPFNRATVDVEVNCDDFLRDAERYFPGLTEENLGNYAKGRGKDWLRMSGNFAVFGGFDLPVYDVWYRGITFEQ